ncbi:MAG: phytanoyl-CoA dioxygenase family protein [Chloroflexota bacterium]
MPNGLTDQQIQKFHDDGFLLVRDCLPKASIQPLIDELNQQVDDLTNQAIDKGILDPKDRHADAPFETRLHLVCNAATDRNWIWREIQSGKRKSPGMFALRSASALLDIVESLIGPEILAHPQFALRAKMPAHEETVVPWHQDLGYLTPEEAGETLVANCWVPLVPATAENGCMEVLAGSHKGGYLPHQQLIQMEGHTARIGIAEEDLPAGEAILCEMDVGDVLLTMERVAHRSIPNTSQTVRWSVDTRYNQIGLPTGRENVPGFIARSANDPAHVTQSCDEWIQLFLDKGLNPTERKEAYANR